MPAFEALELAHAVGGRLVLGTGQKTRGVCINSRLVRRGNLFVAIKGDRFDGHVFTREAFNRGAGAAIISEPYLILTQPQATLILVEDTVFALQELAAYHRRKFRKLIVVGVTGSSGKTTVKNLIAGALSVKYNTLKTEGNLNNHIGTPLTLLNLTAKHQAAVIEMGMSSPGEIARLAKIADPKIGVITNVGSAHMGKLGSVAAVRAAKAELLENMRKGGVAALNADDWHSAPLIEKKIRRTVTFGAAAGASFRLMGSEPILGTGGRALTIKAKGKEYKTRIGLIGLKDAENAVAAFAAAVMAGVEPEKIGRGLAKVKAEKMRMEPVRLKNGALLINDTYNANPQSAEAALYTLAEYKDKGRTIFVLGDMLELGPASSRVHRHIGKVAAKTGVSAIFVLGTHSEDAAAEAARLGVKAVVGHTHEELADKLAAFIKPYDTALIKGSRGSAMEKVVNRLLPVMGGVA
ncbi:MAG: UDP-N-acetylmuramoyl-tripeptide--D-alanyl-D-alanine ligase [Nitrospinae bacterium]|nr:UDP-N-acetylmuramoyl-tripeptide--D-alanyl-D-alanine ligase [Nitrospinota bacterium]